MSSEVAAWALWTVLMYCVLMLAVVLTGAAYIICEHIWTQLWMRDT